MNLTTRAKALQELGFFPANLPIADLVSRAETETGINPNDAPATAILLAAGRVLEISADAATELEDYAALLEKIAAFCNGAFTVANVHAALTDSPQAYGDDEEPEGVEGVLLDFSLDGKKVRSELTNFDDLLDLSFLNEIEERLQEKGEPRRLCPLVELMDDTARYVFIDPEKMEQAELKEIIAAPDFEDAGE